MRILLSLLLIVSYTALLGGVSIEDQINNLFDLLDTDIESAKNLALEIKTESENENDHYGLVQTNYVLGYIYHKEVGDFGKAIIYYLEAIRHGRVADYDGIKKDLISLHKNCGVIFRKFKAFDLAENYYSKAIQIAHEIEDEFQYISLNYNLSIVYQDKGEYLKSIQILSKIHPKVDHTSNKFYDITNGLALNNELNGDYERAVELLEVLLNELPEEKLKMIAYAQHNLARNFAAMGKSEEAITFYNSAIKSKSNNEISSVEMFSSYHELGLLYASLNNLDLALLNLLEAEELIPSLTQKPEYFKIYKSLANTYYNLAEYSTAKHYEDLYDIKLNEYLRLQEQIRETDQRYNMDLITKRYFDEVAKQERISSILFYSKLISGTLLILLLGSIAYYRIDKIRLRRAIERELLALRMID